MIFDLGDEVDVRGVLVRGVAEIQQVVLHCDHLPSGGGGIEDHVVGPELGGYVRTGGHQIRQLLQVISFHHAGDRMADEQVRFVAVELQWHPRALGSAVVHLLGYP